MSFGFSVGDFIAVAQLASSVRKQFVDAPSQFKAISDEVKSFSNALRDVEDLLSEQELTTQQQTESRNMAEGCRNVLKELYKTLGKYQEVDSNPKTFGGKARRVWKRLKWEPDEIKELRGRIVVNITLLNAFHGRLASQISLATKGGVDRLHERQDNRELRQAHQAIVDWLTPIDYAPQQSDFISRRQEGTGQWLLNSTEFKEWVSQSKQTMFCPGIPGAGKTMITSIIVEHLWTQFRNDSSIGIAYLYCNFQRQQEQKPTDLLINLLKQLVQERLSVPENVESLYNRHMKKGTRPSREEISKVLHSIVTDYSRAFIIIDALDECQVSDGSLRRLLIEIFNLQATTKANIFATSRFIPEIMKEFEGIILLEIRATDEDVQRYLEGHMLQLPSFVLRSLDLQEEIKTKIIKAVDGMFLLAQLHLDSLIGKKSPKAIRMALKRLPTGSEAYDHAYKEAMERIEGHIADSKELAKQVLTWITYAKRPLTTLELRHALAVEIGESELDEDNLPEIEDMVSVCAGLVTVDEESDIIRLVHYTTQEFFERTQISWFPNAHTDITMICVSYLSYDAFESGFCPTVEGFIARLQLNVLYDYAARNWGYHASAASARAEESILGFLGSGAKVSACNQAMMVSGNYVHYSQRVPKQTTGVHLAAYLGLREVTVALLKNGHDPNSKDSLGQTPLSWAAENGHEAVMRLLLAKDSVDPDSKGTQYGRTPLSWAAENGYEVVVRLLLAKDSVDPDSKDTQYCRTPLSWAAENGHEAVVRLLLAKDSVDPDSKDTEYGRTPLLWAARSGHEAVVKLLLAKDGVDRNYKDIKYGQTPLSWAAEKGHEAVVRLLLENGADKESIDDHGRSILHLAARGGHIRVVNLLINLGLDINAKDKRGEGALHYAASGGSLQVVERILQLDPVIHADSVGWSPLHWAARSGNLQLFKLLRKAGVVESTCDTLEPLCSWNSLKLAVFHQNQSLATYIMTLVDDITDEHSKAVVRGEQPPTDDSPSILADVLSPIKGSEHESVWCNGCFHGIYGPRYRCLVCPDFDYCFMCKLASEHTHPYHAMENVELLVSL